MNAERMNERVQVILEGETIADTMLAVKLVEEGKEPVIYVPKNDIKEVDLIKCGEVDSPDLGHAEIYTIRHGAHDIENAAWSFDEPDPHLQELQGRVAFSHEKVQEIRIGD
ncbi:MAG: DUF427 domain-containing protein [Bacteriovoracia bacterium]